MKAFRTALFAPGSNDKVMARALQAGADAVLFDLEDSVALTAKEAARQQVAAMLAAPFMPSAAPGATAGPLRMVRVNGLETALTRADLAAVVRPGLDAVMIPKAEDPGEVVAAAEYIGQLEIGAGMALGTVALLLMIESALGVVRCFELARCHPRLAGICIGSARDGDLQTDLGAAWSPEGTELLYARSRVLLETRAAGAHLLALDGVFADLHDEAGLAHDSRLSARLGYVGRTVIHPRQIDIVRRAYAVAPADLAWYRKVAAGFAAAEAAGQAAIAIDGKLVDYAMAARARRVLALAALDPPPD